jgi:hypothetical protein
VTTVVDAAPAAATPSAQRAAPPGRRPARPRPAAWAATSRDRDAVWERLTGPPFAHATAKGQARQQFGLRLLLDWLASYPGDTWQDRWLASGADADGTSWRQVSASWLSGHGHHTATRRELLARAVVTAITADLVRPSPAWLAAANFRKGALVNVLAQCRDPEGFGRLQTACSADPAVSASAA